MLSFQRRAHPSDAVDGHWYGCSYCGRNLCTDCGIAVGRRCDRCGATLEKDRFFPSRVIADGDWRIFLPQFDEWGLSMNNLELVAHATDSELDAILEAIPEGAAEAFWDEVLELELERRLGTLDSLSLQGRATYLLDDAWRDNLARLAAAGLRGRSGIDEAAVSLRLRIAAWIEFPELAVGVPEVVVRALVDGRAWLVDAALVCLATLGCTKADLLERFGGWLGDRDPELRALGTRAMVSALGGRACSQRRESQVEAQAFALVVEALTSRTAEALLDAFTGQPRCAYPIVRLCRELGLAEVLVERFSDMLVRTHPRFAVTVDRLAEALHPGHPLLDEVAAAIDEGVRSKRLQRVLDQVAKDSTAASERVADDEDTLAQHLTFERALKGSPLAPEQRSRLLAQLEDARPMVRAWALRLVGDPERWAIAERDPSELVRELARGRARS